LGNLASRAGEKLRNVITSRGGTKANVNEAGPWADKTLGETAKAAVDGDETAETAIKIAKQARKGWVRGIRRFGNESESEER